MKLNVSQLLIHLIQKRPFYGMLAAGLQLVEDPTLGTVAVGIRNGRNTLFYDKAFLSKAPLSVTMFILEHELLHLALLHIPRLYEILALCHNYEARAKVLRVSNIAMDAAINGMLRRHEAFEETRLWSKERVRESHPEAAEDKKSGMILPENFDLPMDLSFEEYQALLMKQRNEEEQVGGSNHDPWITEGSQSAGEGKGKGKGEGEGKSKGSSPGQGSAKEAIEKMLREMTAEELLTEAHRLREQTKQTLRDAVKSSGGLGRGTVPSQVAEFLSALLSDPVIPWWEIFSSRARASRVAKSRRTVAVPNRMLLGLAEEDARIIPTPGRVKDKAWRVFLYVDTSGSMSTESLEIAKSELQHMLSVDRDMEVRYMEGDAETHTDVLLRQGDEIPKEAIGRGGTDFDEYFRYMKKYVDDSSLAPDLVIVYTDGYAPAVALENRLPSEIPLIWLMTPGYALDFNEGYGEILVCDPKHNEKYSQ